MQKMTLNNIHEWPLMTRMLVLGLVFAVAFYLGYRFDLASQAQNFSRAEQQEADLRQQIELVIHKSKVIQSEVGKLPQLKTELAQWNKQLIPAANVPELLNQILKIGADNHLFFSLFAPGETSLIPLPPRFKPTDDTSTTALPGAATQPAPATPASPPSQNQVSAAAPGNAVPLSYIKVPIKVVVVGSYHQIADFISQVANMQWIVVVGNFAISNENQTTLLGDKLAQQAASQHLLSAEILLEIYHLQESK